MRQYPALALGVVVAAVCARLGLWQLDRLEARRASNAHIAAHLAAPPLDLNSLALTDPSTVPTDSLHYRRALAAGRYDLERQIVVMARASGGIPGVHVVTPLRLTEETAVLVERGWVASPDGRGVDLGALAEPVAAEVEGVLIEPSRPRGAPGQVLGWPAHLSVVIPGALAQAYPYRLLPVVLRRTVQPTGQPPEMRSIPLPELTNGPHLSYAVQWFAFGAIALIGSVLLVVKGTTPERRE